MENTFQEGIEMNKMLLLSKHDMLTFQKMTFIVGLINHLGKSVSEQHISRCAKKLEFSRQTAVPIHALFEDAENVTPAL